MQNPGQATASVAPPQNLQELRALVMQRNELIDQLRALEDQSGQLIQQRMNAQATNSTKEVAQFTQRIENINARIQRLEQQKLASDDAIADAMRRGIATSEEGVPAPPPAPPPPLTFTEAPPFGYGGDNEARAAGIAGTLLAFSLVGYFFWRLGKRRALRQAGVQPGAVGKPDDIRELKTAVDAIALEVERISENQRFVTALLNERADKAALNAGQERK